MDMNEYNDDSIMLENLEENDTDKPNETNTKQHTILEKEKKNNILKYLLKTLLVIGFLAVISYQLWLPVLLELIADCFDGDGRTIFLTIVFVLLLLFALIVPSRYERFKDQSILQRFLFALSYIGFIIVAIIIAAAIEA